MSLDRQHRQKRSPLKSALRTRSSIDLSNLCCHSPELVDMKSSKENLLQVERDNSMKKNECIKEQRHRTNSSKRKSHNELRTIHLDEVAWHDATNDCWLVIHDYVYDCTEFLNNHPGGQDILLEYAGRDATLAFIGTGHSTVAKTTLDQYKIGELPPKERIFRVSNGVKISGF
ncbi:Cytochrome b5 [Camponotus floridanus]|uniref:Cytochrome b5 n=1 Tax=Camponotus floridanus TaxID=104421 RepID=E2AEZ9_CAMFO|nr:cytochrome B5-like protein [Camponotus floridanus]EFN67954.1 Cytochrome b5 [Camponotus floridanus]